MDELVELCVKAIIIDTLTDHMMPIHEARQRADSLWKSHKEGALSQAIARNEYDVRVALDALTKGGYEIVKKA